MAAIDGQKLRDIANDDPEFRRAARRWSVRLRLRVGDDAQILALEDGIVAGVNGAPTFWDPWDVDVAAPDAEWRKLLAPVPPPMYQDIFPAQLHGGFSFGGDLELLFGHYAAMRRLVELMRRAAVSESEEAV